MLAQRNVRGITLIGFLFLLIILGFFIFIGMRLLPMYTEYMGVSKAMEQLKGEPGIASKSIEEIRRLLSIKFDTQYVDDSSIPKGAIQLNRGQGNTSVSIKYERRVPFIYNVDFVATFQKTVDLSGAGY